MALAGSERAQIRQQFEAIEGPLKLEYFHQSPRRVVVPGRPDRPSCELAKELYEEIADLSDHISLTIYEHEESAEQVKRRDIVDVPCVLIRGELNRPLRFYGAPNGHLLVAMIRAIVLASTRQAKPSVQMKAHPGQTATARASASAGILDGPECGTGRVVGLRGDIAVAEVADRCLCHRGFRTYWGALGRDGDSRVVRRRPVGRGRHGRAA